MSMSEPLWISEGAWSTIRDRVIGPADQSDAGVAALARAWDEPVRDGDRVGVFIDGDQARTLGTLLDAHPDVARLLG
jgi:hypothetical protein